MLLKQNNSVVETLIPVLMFPPNTFCHFQVSTRYIIIVYWDSSNLIVGKEKFHLGMLDELFAAKALWLFLPNLECYLALCTDAYVLLDTWRNSKARFTQRFLGNILQPRIAKKKQSESTQTSWGWYNIAQRKKLSQDYAVGMLWLVHIKSLFQIQTQFSGQLIVI